MDFFEAVRVRRSVRRFTEKEVPEEVVQKALDAALLAPNSSNLQTWQFFWVRSPEKRKLLVKACLNQSAARTAKELIVVVSSLKLWKQNCREVADKLKGQGMDAKVMRYYDKLIPFVYGYRWLAPIKWLAYNFYALTKPFPRHPWSTRDLEEVSIKSAALASENLMLAFCAQGFDTCPMEGMDEVRVKKLLELGCSDRVVMVLAVGDRHPDGGITNTQIRLPRDRFVHQV